MRTAPVLAFAALVLSFSGSAAAQPTDDVPQASPSSQEAPDNERAEPSPHRRVRRLRLPPFTRSVRGPVFTPAPLAPTHGSPPASEPEPNTQPPPVSADPSFPMTTDDALSHGGKPPTQAFEFGDPSVGVDGLPLAGYHDGRFYLRNRTDYFRLFLRSRLHLDAHSAFGPGVEHTDLKPTLLLRRARIELAGEIMGHWQWELQFEAGPTAFNNASGTTEASAAPAGVQPTAETAAYAPVQTAGYSTRPLNAYVNYRASDHFNIKIGQFNIPFTAENRTSTNNISFLERAMPTRAWGAPETQDIGAMVWGHLDQRTLFWSWAVLQGDGPNRPNADSRAMTAARVYTRPLATEKGPLQLLQIGASFKYAMHDKNFVAYDYPSMGTQSGYRFWTPSYTDSVGMGRKIHVIPSGAQIGVAGELRVPFDRWDLRSEVVYLNNNTREGVDGFQKQYTERFGTMKGVAYHVTASYWLLGKPFFPGIVGDRQPSRLQLDKPDPGVPPHGVELALKWEQLIANYQSAARSGQVDENNIDGDIRVNAVSAAASYWASKHLRVSLNYVLNHFPEASATGSSEQRAKAPGNRIAPGLDNEARQSATTLHEVAARIAVAF
ncbi:MAG TPA: porin [Polyangiaceae bacterium]|nr:MAG: Phosphate-selective porin O and P [Deltaproteobacteria bacterium ADurb.Bin207]HNS95597.1 porin [Polyangiaceae bacterium]HNZ21249.1 porin [Polyangiaceae bacterium]HOD21065.1 porin [Polyangiaceae bacterium]HOE48637.1 porin [Polyangiaceae bacterium]